MGPHSWGIVRRIDRLGRVVLPKDRRDAFRLDRDVELAVEVDGDALVLKRTDLICVFCGSTEHVLPFKGKAICVDCVRDVRGLASEG